ncbi:MAG TPA: glycosyltransferase family 2 protein [Bryobacteraceae bacterium]
MIIPTLNERENIIPLWRSLQLALNEIDYEIVFVDDDSDDGTGELARAVAQDDHRVRVIQRIGRTGLASAVIEGMMATTAPAIAVIDGDLQHDESVLPQMLEKLKSDNLDIVIGTRNAEGGSMGSFGAARVSISLAGRNLSRAICPIGLSDPMSGYFVVTRAFVDEVVHSLTGRGFKVLLDLVASCSRPVRFSEVGYTFRERSNGKSKLTLLVALEYMELIADKLVGAWIPVSYVTFALVGTLGVLFYLAFVYALLSIGSSFGFAQILSGTVVIVLNFLLNNQLTFRASRLKGRRSILMGMAAFSAACAVGLISNLQTAELLRQHGVVWYASSLIGLMIGSIWNYWTSSIFIWQVNRYRNRVRSRRRSETRAAYSTLHT